MSEIVDDYEHYLGLADNSTQKLPANGVQKAEDWQVFHPRHKPKKGPVFQRLHHIDHRHKGNSISMGKVVKRQHKLVPTPLCHVKPQVKLEAAGNSGKPLFFNIPPLSQRAARPIQVKNSKPIPLRDIQFDRLLLDRISTYPDHNTNLKAVHPIPVQVNPAKPMQTVRPPDLIRQFSRPPDLTRQLQEFTAVLANMSLKPSAAVAFLFIVCLAGCLATQPMVCNSHLQGRIIELDSSNACINYTHDPSPPVNITLRLYQPNVDPVEVSAGLLLR